MKRQHIIGIAVGILVGSIVALFFGNTLTAVLIGTIAIFATTWVAGLQWSRAVELSTEVTEKMSIRGTGKILRKAISCTAYYSIIRPSKRIFYEIPKRMKRDVAFRKIIAYVLTLIVIISGMCYFGYIISVNIYESDVTSNIVIASLCVIYIAVLFVFSIIPFISIIVSSFWFVFFSRERDFNGHAQDLIYSMFDSTDEANFFMAGLLSFGMEDNRNAFSSVFYMLKIRIRNGLMMCAFPFILILYGFLALATHHTALYAFVAMIAGAIHLSISYHFGWIDWGNINFILSVVVTMLCGCTIGWIIGKLSEHIKVPKINLPTVFRKHEEVKVVV